MIANSHRQVDEYKGDPKLKLNHYCTITIILLLIIIMIKCRLIISFALLRSVILCVQIQEARLKPHCPFKLGMMDIVQSEAHSELTH